MKLRLLSFVVAALFVGAAVAAGTGVKDKPVGAAPAQSFQTYDSNNDSVLSRDEASRDPTLVRVFDELDRDKDGQLSKAEYGGQEGTIRRR
jgi:hypothetical protein